MVEIRSVSTARAKGGAWAFVLCQALLLLFPRPAATEASDPSWPKISVQRLDDRLAALIDRDRLLDTLHFGWFDQPYERATLAVAVRSVTLLEDEVAARGAGRQILSDAQVQSMIAWTTDALDRVVGTRVDDGFRPHRIRVVEADLLDPASSLPPLYGFIDVAPAAQGQLDLLAALGTRVLGRSAGEAFDIEGESRIAKRAHALGMAVAYLHPSSKQDSPPSPAQAAAWRSMTLRALLEATPKPESQRTRSWALADPLGEEPLASSLARRALMRGVTGSRHYTVCPWQAPRLGSGAEEVAARVRAAMWMHVFEGQALALLEEWGPLLPYDRHAGRQGGFANPRFNPAYAEAVAHGALDLLRIGDRLGGFASRPYLALAIDNDAVDPRDDNRWAGWIEPIWEGLLDSQVRFDVIPVRRAEEASARGYGKIYRLRKAVSTDPKFALLRLKHKLALLPEHVNRLTARTALGLIAERVWIRDGLTEDGRGCVAVANLSDEPRVLRLRGGSRLGAVRDLRSGETIESPTDGVAFAPRQLRVLWPMEN
jgi:hypothetical protein